MTNITEQAEWSPSVYLIDFETPVVGGVPEFNPNGDPTSGWANAQAKQLADRTQYLKDTLESTDIDVGDLTGRVGTVETNLTSHIGSRGSAHTNATTTEAGFMSASDKTKLNGIATGAQVNVATDLAQGTRTTTTVLITSSTGAAATLNTATTSFAGMLSSADKTKLDGIASGAQVNTVTSVATKTGAITLVKGDVGLGNVDNTADTAKPISTAQQTALNLKAPLASPALTGVPTAPTASVGTNTTQLATTAFVLANTPSTTQPYLQVQDQQSSGTAGGSSVAVTWTSRNLNTIVLNQVSGASLASNTITLPAGTYYTEVVSTIASSYAKIRLFIVATSTSLVTGINSGSTSSTINSICHAAGVFTLASTATISLQYYNAGAAVSTTGLGQVVGAGLEIYSDVRIWKLS